MYGGEGQHDQPGYRSVYNKIMLLFVLWMMSFVFVRDCFFSPFQGLLRCLPR